MLIGGAGRGGTVIAAVAQHYGLEPARSMATLFPESRGNVLRQTLVIA